MTVEVEGLPNEQGMLMDFKVLKRVLTPLVNAWDHAILVSRDDDELRSIIAQTTWKHYVLPFDSTAENLVTYVADFLVKQLMALEAAQPLTGLRIRLSETDTCYAETARAFPSEQLSPG